jgi:hypothetical protein
MKWKETSAFRTSVFVSLGGAFLIGGVFQGLLHIEARPVTQDHIASHT